MTNHRSKVFYPVLNGLADCLPSVIGFYLVFLTACLASAASPQQGSSEELQLLKEESVVTSARYEQPISQAASNVYVITDEDIRHSGATDIPTLLRRVPGIEVIQMSGADFNISARGNNQMAANKLLVIIDGRSFYEDTLGEVFWKAIPVTLPEIKRIEVLKGPASALYGFNAFDGVINIITKSPEEMKGSTNGSLLQFGGGEFGTISAAAVQAGTSGKFGYRLSLGRDQNNEWRKRDALAFRSNKLNVHTEYAVSESTKLKITGGYLDANRVDALLDDILIEQTKLTNGYTQAAYEGRDFFLRASWTHWDQPSLETLHPNIAPFALIFDRNGNPLQSSKRNKYDLEAQHSVELGADNRLTYGANYRHNVVTSNFLDQQTSGEVRFGVYFQDEWHVTKAITAVAGLRYDLHSEINPTYSPRLALLYKPADDHTIRAAWSVAYRPPTIFETHLESHGSVCLFGTFPVCGFALPTVLRGSRNLEAEKISSFDAGYQGWYLRHRLRLRGDLFYNHISNFISSEGMTPSGERIFDNIGKADIYGGEAGVEFLATSWLTGFANYSYEKLWQSSDIVNQNLIVQRGAPSHKINAGLRGEWDNGINGEAVIHHVSTARYPINAFFDAVTALGPPPGPPAPDRRVGNYTLLNLRVAYQFLNEKAEVAVSVYNALNDRHKEHPLGDTIGSRAMGWLTLRY